MSKEFSDDSNFDPFEKEKESIDYEFLASSFAQGRRGMGLNSKRVTRIREMANGICKDCFFLNHGTYPNSRGEDVEFIECLNGRDPLLKLKKGERKCSSKLEIQGNNS